MFRTTREQLRRYHRQGLLADPVPVRYPQPCWLAMNPQEWSLHQRVEEETRCRLEGSLREARELLQALGTQEIAALARRSQAGTEIEIDVFGLS